jgi:hypothetical protein
VAAGSASTGTAPGQVQGREAVRERPRGQDRLVEVAATVARDARNAAARRSPGALLLPDQLRVGLVEHLRPVRADGPDRL